MAGPIARRICFAVALLLLARYALSSQQALLENTIRPEGMLAFFEMGYLYCLISYFAARWRLRRTGAAIVSGAAALALSYVVLLLKPSWGFSFVFTFLCIVASAFGGARRLIRFGPLLAGGAAIVLIFLLPRLLCFQKDAQSFLPFNVVCIPARPTVEAMPDPIVPSCHQSAGPSP